MRSAAILIALLALFAIFAQGAELTQKKPVVLSKTMVPKEHLTERSLNKAPKLVADADLHKIATRDTCPADAPIECADGSGCCPTDTPVCGTGSNGCPEIDCCTDSGSGGGGSSGGGCSGADPIDCGTGCCPTAYPRCGGTDGCPAGECCSPASGLFSNPWVVMVAACLGIVAAAMAY